MLQRDATPLPERWLELVAAWRAFEEEAKYQDDGYLSSSGRPPCVGLWIGRHRSITWRPALPNLLAFEKQFRQWWISLQPDWRVSEAGNLIPDELEGDWGELRKSGINGILGALVCLFYWGLEVKGNGKRYQSWVDHVEDCILVLQHFV